MDRGFDGFWTRINLRTPKTNGIEKKLYVTV